MDNYARNEHLVTCPYCSRMFRAGMEDETTGRGREVLKCNKCSHMWVSRIADPKRCPKCGTHRWNDCYIRFECRICGHSWDSCKKKRRCPRCSSPNWETGENPSMGLAYAGRFGGIPDEDVTRCHEAGMNVVEVALFCDVPLLDLVEFYNYNRWDL